MDALRDTLSGLTPQFFDGLVLVIIALGLVLAARRLRADLRRRPRTGDTQPLQE